MATRRGIVRRVRERWPGRRGALAGGALALPALIVLVRRAPAGRVPSEDTGVFTYVARLIGDGGLPYRDAWDHKPPGVYLIDAVALAVAGLWGLWAAEVVALALAAILSYRALANTGLGGAAALAGTFAWLVALPRLFLEDGVQTNFSELFALPLQLAALDLFAREEARPRPTWRTAAIGTLGGSTLLLKPTVGAIWIAIALTLVVTRVRARRYVDLGWRVVFLAVPAAIPVARVAARARRAGRVRREPARAPSRLRRGATRADRGGRGHGDTPGRRGRAARARTGRRDRARGRGVCRCQHPTRRDRARVGVAVGGARSRGAPLGDAVRVPVRGPRDARVRGGGGGRGAARRSRALAPRPRR